MPRRPKQQQGCAPKVRRNRATPARLVKLCKDLSPDQRRIIEDMGFGGLLKIACHTLPAEFSSWLMADCFDAETSQRVLPGRGRIAVTAESVHDIFELPIGGDKVKYELDVEAIDFIHEKYGLDKGCAPRIETILTRLKTNKEADEDFQRSFLMIAVSTFLCHSSSLCISPRCYPPLVDMSRVDKLNWCQFVVDHLVDAASKIEKKNTVRSCLLLLVILYVDSLDLPNLQVPPRKPRAAAWNRKLLDHAIKLDTNRDGSFGKLKIRNLGHSAAVQGSLFNIDDIRRFVSSKVPRSITEQGKRQLTTAVSKFCQGFTELMGNFLQDLSKGEASEPQASTSGVETRSKRARRNGQLHIELESDYNEESDPDFNEESDSDCNEEDELFGSDSDYDEDDDSFLPMDGDPPSDGGQEQNETNGDGDPADRNADGHRNDEQERRDGDPAANGQQRGNMTINEPTGPAQPQEGYYNHPVGHEDGQNHGNDDEVPLIVRLKKIQSTMRSASKEQSATRHCIRDVWKEPVPLEVVAPPLMDLKSRRDRLMLPRQLAADKGQSSNAAVQEEGNTSVLYRSNSWDFTPPECNIVKFVEEEEEEEEDDQATHQAGASFTTYEDLEDVPGELLLKIEEDYYNSLQQQNVSSNVGETSIRRRNNNQNVVTGSKEEMPLPTQVITITPPQMLPELGSANSSITPSHQPPPRRVLKRPAALQSPYIDFAARKVPNCSKAVRDLYNAVCAARGSFMIINYWHFHVTLDDLKSSVKPRGNLSNTCAEIGLYVVDPKGRKAIKRVLPLRVSTLLQAGQLDRMEVKRAFRLETNHLDHRQMVMFPVLQNIGTGGVEPSGHYFLLVLNLRSKRFEVLDSMRTLEDEMLSNCCKTLIEAIKQLWQIHYPETKTPIDTYEVVDIGVPIQRNIHDCGFHMLMHAEFWDSRSICNFQEKDMLNIQKLLTHKWITHAENDAPWKEKLNLT